MVLFVTRLKRQCAVLLPLQRCCVVYRPDSSPNPRWQRLPYYQSPVTSVEITPTHDGRSFVSTVIAPAIFPKVADLIVEHRRGWLTKSQIICGKRAVNYDVLNCVSLGLSQLSEKLKQAASVPHVMEVGTLVAGVLSPLWLSQVRSHHTHRK